MHCSPIVRNHPNSASILLCLNGAIFFKQYLTNPDFKHIENLFVHINMFSVCLKIGMDRCCMKQIDTV